MFFLNLKDPHVKWPDLGPDHGRPHSQNTEHKQIIEDVIRMVRVEIGPVAAFKVAVIVKRLPKTRSGKILRGIIQKIADSADYDLPATIDDPHILMEIKEALQKIGYAT